VTGEGAGDGNEGGADADGNVTINPDVWDELRLLGEPDGEDFLAELVDGFVEDTEHRLDLLDGALASQDAGAAARLAHSLKGSSAQLGFQRLAATCASLERLALTGSLSGATTSVEQLRSRYQAVRRALAVSLRPV
jgi:HPt (histidine-containing phosphotransfer) domain-containing protein